MAYGIPVILVFNLFLLIYKVFKRQLSALYPLVVLIAGNGFIRDTFTFNNHSTQGKFKVISFNTRVFNVYFDNGKDTASVHEMIQWIKAQDADIVCLQEFYNDPGSKVFNTIHKIRKNHNYNYFHSPKVINRIGGEFGDIIFSKYPIVKKGEIKFEENPFHKVIFVDVKIDSDTVRFYNMHLQSLHIIEDELINSDNLQSGFKILTTNMKNGFIQRAEQIQVLTENLKDCPYPVVLCGDLNDLPYSFAYQQLNEYLNNSFSEAGNGFGFTFNGKLFFLRIDNQFYSEGLAIQTYRTHREMKCSDHFPISATYSIIETAE